MDPETTVRAILATLADAKDNPAAGIDARGLCDDLRAWIRRGGFRPYGWSADACAAFVTACYAMADLLSAGMVNPTEAR